MNESMNTLKQQAITNTLAKAKTLDPNNNLTLLNVLKTLYHQGTVLETRDNLGLTAQRITRLDIVYSSLVYLQILVLIVLIGLTPLITTQATPLNTFGIYGFETLYLYIGLNALVMGIALYFTHTKLTLLITKVSLLIIGIYTFPIGLLLILSGILYSDDLNATRKTMLNKLFKQGDNPTHSTFSYKAFIGLFTVLIILFGVSLMRETVNVEDYHHINYYKNVDDQPGVSFNGYFNLEAIDETTTKVHVPSIVVNVHYSYLDDYDNPTFNYTINDTKALEWNVEFRRTNFNEHINQSFVIEAPLQEVVEHFEMEIIFTDDYLDNSNVIMTYTITEDHIRNSQSVYEVFTRWR